ncbi:DUF2470 domain-containing protein [Synechococcus elongatus IITB7]|uniref:DUF2470 domain-containing protein n=1 Tax=Synechococcus elongatus TaxID=32046 RepID=UPI0030CDB53A
MADPLTPAVSDRICRHMNEDHADAVLVYAKVYGGATEATAATLTGITPAAMVLDVVEATGSRSLQVSFDHELQDSEDAHQTLIAMLRSARASKA